MDGLGKRFPAWSSPCFYTRVFKTNVLGVNSVPAKLAGLTALATDASYSETG